MSAQIARRGGLLIERIKSLRTLEKLTIRNYYILAIKTGPMVCPNGENERKYVLKLMQVVN